MRLFTIVFSCAALGTACLGMAGQSTPPAFEGTRAFEHIRRLVEIGPRPAGSPGAASTRAYITKELTALGLTVTEQPFEASTPLGPLGMVNLRVLLPGHTDPSEGRLIIGGHYDTKLFPEFTFVGANDGGSSTAFLIELARVLKDRRNPLAIELVFFDGEEAVIDWNAGDDNTYGSRHYVETARGDGTLRSIRAMILVDMIGDRGLRILRESHSTRWLTDIIWNTAKTLKRPEFLDDELAVEDDHLPFLQAGIPAVNIIDLDYGPWHTAGDTLDKVSAHSLQVVADVLLAALPEIEARLMQSGR